jgi:hypothetical protein
MAYHISTARPLFAANPFSDPDCFFFYHTINMEDLTLRVQVLGPNLSQTFQHSRESRSVSAAMLANKTVGFLVIAHRKSSKRLQTTVTGQTRQIVAWAQSGHGMGSRGDSLVPGDWVLRNKYWTKRAIQLSKILGVNAAHPFDQGHEASFDEERVGAYRAAHVEVKLATHAVHVLLEAFAIPYNKRNVTMETLAKLQSCHYPDGSSPVVEIYFSRKNCIPCGMFVQRLQTCTGVTFRLIWRHRLVRMEFRNEMALVNQEGPIVVDDSEDDQAWIDEAIDIDGPSDSEDLMPLEGQPIEIDDDEEEDVEIQIIEAAEMLNNLGLVTNTESRSSTQRRDNDEAINGFIDSISFALGQSEFRPDTARVAVVDLARGLRIQRQRKETTRTPPNTRRGRPTHRQPRSAPGALTRHRNRSLTPGRPPRRPRASSTFTLHARGRSSSPASVIDLLETSPCQRHVRRRRQRD